MKMQYRPKRVALAVGMGLALFSHVAIAQEEDEVIEEVVATASRLQGTAAAVIEERKNQAFVADILGAEQLARTGDSDAASALRRVTGLTLVDGKYIYVRGLGERYSSARLNGANIPSPDLTRNVIPLDIFPASIIESLAVQKAYSPSMPAAFGGGSIDIRTKSVPTNLTAGFEIGGAYDSSADKGIRYSRNDAGMPLTLTDAITNYRGDFSASSIINRSGLQTNDQATAGEQAVAMNKELLKSLPRDFSGSEESLDPAYNFKVFLGNSFEVWGGDLGFLTSLSYDNDWDAADVFTGVIAPELTNNCNTEYTTFADVENSCYNTFRNGRITTHNERTNAVFNLGYKRDGHSITWNNIVLQDNEDEVDFGLLESPAGSSTFSIVGDGQANRTHEFIYEERELKISQVIGQHTFMDLKGLGFDWQYTRSEATTEIPVNASFRFRDRFEDGIYTGSIITGDDNRAVYAYTDMEDHVDSYSGNFTLPFYISNFEMEFKAGYDFTDRARVYNTSSFAVNAYGTAIDIANGGDALASGSFLTDSFIDSENVNVTFNEPTVPDADDYIAAQKIEAGYGAFDVIYDNTWRISGGVRFESFRQVSIGTSSLIFDADDLNTIYSEERLNDASINDEELFPALSLTFMGGEDYQIRLGYGETVVRPDLREVVPVTYFDPLTDIRTFGRVGLQSSPIKNFDLRYEYYGAAGNNFSVAAFYKDIQAPIETVLSVGDEDYSATFINGDTAELFGVEAEWLYDLTDLREGLFTSGNITVSDSEAVVNPALAGNLTNPTKRMTGHSQYVVNLQLNYDSIDGLHSSSLVYNVFGERILAAGVIGREDAFEQPFHSLDFVHTYYPDFNSQVKFKVQNLLDESQQVTQSEVVVRSRDIGVGVSLSYQYQF